MFLEISQNSQENTCARVSFLIKLQAKASRETASESPSQLSYMHKISNISFWSVDTGLPELLDWIAWGIKPALNEYRGYIFYDIVILLLQK